MPKEDRVVEREVKNAKLYSDGSILLTDVRASYPHVLNKWKGKGADKAKFSIVCLIPKKKSHREARELLKEVIDDILKENKVKKMKEANLFLRDGDLSDKDENEGNWTVNAGGDRVVCRDNVRVKGKLRILKAGEDDDRIYGGCYVNVLIRPWFQNNEHGKKVNAGLIACQFVRDGDPFGEGRISDDEIDSALDEYAEDDDDEYDDDDDDDEDEPPRKKKSNVTKLKSKAKSKKRNSRDDDEDDDI